MLTTFPLYNTPISPESKGNVLKPGKDNDQNINPEITRVKAHYYIYQIQRQLLHPHPSLHLLVML